MNQLKKAVPAWILVMHGGLVVLSGCATGASPGSAGSDGYPAQRALVGKTKKELVACAGSPAGIDMNEGRPRLIYYQEASQLEESFAGSKSSFAKVHHGCRAMIAFDDDRVSSVTYMSEPSSYQDDDHCEEIFARCLGR